MENTVQDDYLSEKFYQPFTLPVINIYRGAPNANDFAPATPRYLQIGSNQTDFTALADTIRYLASNDNAYLRYFKWKLKRPLSVSNSFAWAFRYRLLNLGCSLAEKYLEEGLKDGPTLHLD